MSLQNTGMISDDGFRFANIRWRTNKNGWHSAERIILIKIRDDFQMSCGLFQKNLELKIVKKRRLQGVEERRR